MYANRESYLHAPLAIVTAELRLNYEPRIKDDAVRDQFATAVRSRFPILRNEQVVTLTIQAAGQASVKQEHVPQLRATSRDAGTTVALNPTSLSISMSGDAYDTYEKSFEPQMAAAVNALRAVLGDVVVVERLGLRFIDEIRPPQPPTSTEEWGRWVNPQLLGAAGALGAAPAGALRSSLVHRPDLEHTVTFQCGEFEGVTVVDPGLPFARKDQAASKMFVLDLDSAWAPTGFALLEPKAIMDELAKLHGPVGELFQWSITEDARAMFRKEGVDDV